MRVSAPQKTDGHQRRSDAVMSLPSRSRPAAAPLDRLWGCARDGSRWLAPRLLLSLRSEALRRRDKGQSARVKARRPAHAGAQKTVADLCLFAGGGAK